MGNSLYALVTTSTLDDLEIVARIDWGKVHGRAPRLMAARLRTAALQATKLQAPLAASWGAGRGAPAGCGASDGRVDGRTRSRIAWKNTYSGGIAKIPRNDAKIIPPNTGVPTWRRASCEAPVAMTSGSSPR